MNHSRIIAAVLALVMIFSLTACGAAAGSSSSASTSAEASTSAAAAASASASGTEEESTPVEIPAAALDDVVGYLTDGALTSDTVVATVNGVEVTAAELTYMVAYNQYSIMNNAGVTDMSQVIDAASGTTIGNYIFDTSLETIVAYKATALEADSRSVAIPEEALAALDTLHDSGVANHGNSQWTSQVNSGKINPDDFTDEEKEAWIKEHGEELFMHTMMFYATNENAYTELSRNFYAYSALQSHLFGDGGEFAPTEDTLTEYINAYKEDNGILWGRCILFSTMDCSTDEEIAEVKAQAEEAFAALSELSGDELSTAFTEYQSQYDKSGYTAGEVQQYTKNDSLVDGYYSGLEALNAGEIAMTDNLGTSTTNYGFFILLREADNDESLNDSAKTDYITESYDRMITEWIDSATVEYGDEYSNLDRLAFFTKLSELQNILYSIDAA